MQLSATVFKNVTGTAPVASPVAVVNKSHQLVGSASTTVDTQSQSFADVGQRVRKLLDAKYADAAKAGTRVKYDMSEQGVRADYSSFSDQEVAAIALNRDGRFNADESGWARAELGGRVAVALQPFDDAVMHGHDRRGHALAINLLYNGMTQEVRAALHWDEAMMVSNNEMLTRDTRDHGAIDRPSVLQLVLDTRSQGRPLGIDFLNKGENFNFDWSPLFYTPSTFAKKDEAPAYESTGAASKR